MRTLDGEMPVVVTGMGVIAPNGIGSEAFWNGLLHPTPGKIETTYQVGPIADELLPEDFRNPKVRRRLDNFSVFALAAAFEATNQAGISGDVAPNRLAVVISTGDGGEETREADIVNVKGDGDPRFKLMSPFHVPASMPNAAAAHVSRYLGAGGPSECGVEACASGALGIIKGLRILQLNQADAVVVGASEATAQAPYALAGFRRATALSNEGISRPFDEQRDGFIPGEGAGVFVIETLERAQARGATPLAEIVGYGSTSDHGDITQPDPEGDGLTRAILESLAMGTLRPEDVGHINAHGTSTKLNDEVEALVFSKLFPHNPYVTSIKGSTGHGLGAAGAIETAATIMALRQGLISPTNNYHNRDPNMPYINLVTGQPARWDHDGHGVAINVNAAFGGHNSALVLRALINSAA